VHRRILVLFPGSLGDFLCFLPVLRFIHAANPESTIEVVARGDGLLLAQRLPEVARTLSLESSTFAKLFSSSLFLNTEEEQFFTAADELLSWFGHARLRISETLLQTGVKRVHSFAFFTGQEDCHATAYYLRCVGENDLCCPSLILKTEEKQWLDVYWQRCGWGPDSRLLVLHPGSGGKKKRWVSEGFTQIVQWWKARKNSKVLILLGPAEEQEAEDWRLVGQVESALSIEQAAAVLSRAEVYVGNDSGVSHLAGAVGARGVVLFGLTRPQQWRPLGGALSVLRNVSYRTEYPDVAGITLSEIAVEEVIAALIRLGV
jgi:ADP-heptose:LPS heptosyltransferase